MISSASARLLNHRDYGITVGLPADLVVLDCESGMQAVCELAQPLFGLKRGRRTFDRPLPILHHPT
jgi:cytosine deaminase